jgi:hypothetical protein
MSTSTSDKKQVLRNKNIGLLNSSVNLLRDILVKENIGKYEMLDSVDGIGYVPNLYSNINNKPYSNGKIGLLGFTHLIDNEHPKSIGKYINETYKFGDDIEYYSINSENKSHKPYQNYNFYNEYLDYLNFNFGNKAEIKDVMNGIFSLKEGSNFIGFDSKKFSTVYSVITDIFQYSSLKYIMEKNRVGVVNPDPIMSLGGVVVTNTRDFSGTDTKLGLITNQMYAHSLHNGAQFNTLRKTKYITPEVYNYIGNKMDNLSVLQATFRIDEKTGRLMYEMGTGYGVVELEGSVKNDFISKENEFYSKEGYHTPLFNQLYSNTYHPGLDDSKTYLDESPYSNKDSINIENIEVRDDFIKKYSVLNIKVDKEELPNPLYQNIYLNNNSDLKRTVYYPYSPYDFDNIQNKTEDEINDLSKLPYADFLKKSLLVFKVKNKVTNAPLYENLVTNTLEHYYRNYKGEVKQYNAWNDYYSTTISSGDAKTINLEKSDKKTFESDNTDKLFYYNDKETTGSTALYNNILHKDNEYTPFKHYGKKEDIEKGYSVLNKNTNNNTQYTWNDKNDGSKSFSVNGETYYAIQENDAPLSTLTSKIIKSFKKDKSGFVKNRTLISRFHTEKGENGKNEERNQFQTSVSKFGLSHGRNLLKKSGKADKNGNPYSRTWTNAHQYDRLSKTIRPFLSDEETGSVYSFSEIATKLNRDENFAYNSTLSKNGLPTIAPDKNNLNSSLKNCMFSIENLAWKDIKIEEFLSPEQVGPNGGRIMWFPPYNLKFNEAVQSNWNPISFIGRGEKIWTYIDTDRSGTLSFTLLVDHPSVLNKWNIKTQHSSNLEENEQTLLRFFAGSEFFDLQNNEINVEDTKSITDILTVEDSLAVTAEWDEGIRNYAVFFPFNYHKGNNIQETIDDLLNIDKTSFLNYSNDEEYIPFKELNEIKNKEELKENIKEIELFGCYSEYENDKELGLKRAKFIKEYLINKFGVDGKIITIKNGGLLKSNKYTTDELDYENVYARCVLITIRYNDAKILESKDINSPDSTTNEIKYTNNGGRTITESSMYEISDSYKVDNSDELLFFKNLEMNDNILYKKIVDKVKYFIPAFHSMTPEGFNERLGFLHQCTRQGHTFSTSNQKRGSKLSAGNLSFGRPPICILRIGDFYNTKIIIQSISINYEDPELQWDMNPEGIGMQPLYASISINFTFLGGSDISSPISRLQNAVSFNYYANQSVYEPKSDTASKPLFRYGYNE